ncbi:MAG: TIGR01212 family radical SAM protein [Prevotellaceae bacterium]|jgi:radical SAM protein (TIGR01212 family)|nr:TIGR01212 family radical SAM protein [Prevotellaceae bacterium]
MDFSLYNNYNLALRAEFGCRVQKISINGGFTCPNRDGSKGTGGCTYCNNQSFHPDYCQPTLTPLQQVEKGIYFFRKYASQKYLVYFQSYTNTYAPLEVLDALYQDALAHPHVVGIVIGTRPDCVDDRLLDYFADLAQKYYVMIEYGVESTCDETLRFINRGHDYATAVTAITATAERGIRTSAHLILGLPGETRAAMLHHADCLNRLPLTALKIHQLQLIRGTFLAQQAAQSPDIIQMPTLEAYIDLVIDFLERLDRRIAIERFVSQSPKSLLIAPDWGIKNYTFTAKLERRMRERQTFQGAQLSERTDN